MLLQCLIKEKDIILDTKEELITNYMMSFMLYDSTLDYLKNK